MQKTRWVYGLGVVVISTSVVVSGCNTNSGNQSNQSAGNASNTEKKNITVSIYDRGSIAQEEGTIENNRWTKWVNENGPANVKFVAIPRSQPEEKINVLYASGSAPDLLFEYSPKTRDTLLYQKQFHPLDELINQHSVEYKKLLQENPMLRKVGTKDGKLYYFGRLNSIAPLRGFLIRTDWLEKLNLKMPTTTDELYEVIKAFTLNDPDGNGKKDTYGFALSSNTGANLKQTFGASTNWVVKNGELVPGWDNLTAYHQFAKRLYDEGLVDPDFINDKNGAKSKQDFINGKLGIFGFLESNPIKLTQEVMDPLKKNVSSAKTNFMAYPQSPQGAFLPTLQNPVQMTAAISRSAKNPDAVIKYVDFLLKESTSTALQFGEAGVHHEVVAGCPVVSNSEKHKKEVGDLTLDMRMLQNYKLSKCDVPLTAYKGDPRVQEYQDVYDTFRKTYYDFSRSYPELTHSEHMPTVPKELNTFETNANTAMGDIWLKAIVTQSYSIDKALTDVKAAWSKASGAEIEKWYKEWYAAEKDNALLGKDIVELAKKQYEEYLKLKSEMK